jgi:DNA-binding FadR family transcriptional regulator
MSETIADDNGQWRHAPLQRVTLAEQIETQLKYQIVSNELKPGDAIPSSFELAAQFGVSRTIVREALKSLQAKGLIDIANGKRATVKPISSGVLSDFFDRFSGTHQEAVIELLELRRGVEVQAAGMAAQRRTSEDMNELWRLIRAMGAAKGNVDAFIDIDFQLHLAIVSAAKNRMMYFLYDSIRAASRDTMREGFIRHPYWANIHASHISLVMFIDAGDAAAAEACMAAHLDDAMAGVRTPTTLAR